MSAAVSNELSTFLREEALKRFLRYVRIDTTSDEDSGKHPSTSRQADFARLLGDELKDLGLLEVEVDEAAYVYARLPASQGAKAIPVSFLAHLDTSASVSGRNVQPRIFEKYNGGVIRYPDDPELSLDPLECPELLQYVGESLIVASGNTLLGADDKSGIAEIMAGLAALQRFAYLKRPEIRVCFTPDEEIGEGTARIRLDKLGKVAYTFDGSGPGELEDECFHACSVRVRFSGLNVHPGMAKNKMVNAGAIAARFFSLLPEWQTPERTELREGFIHLTKILGSESEAELHLILRDFDRQESMAKMELLKSLQSFMEQRYPGLKIALEFRDQYRNMKEMLEKNPQAVQMARKAIEMAGLKVRMGAIRGGTDGAKLSFMGIPTPNIFTGGVLFHSKKEWIAVSSLQKAAEVFIHLCDLWSYER